MKKILGVLLATGLVGAILWGGQMVSAAALPTHLCSPASCVDPTVLHLYANGTPIVIDEDSSGNTVVEWAGTGSPFVIPSTVTSFVVFGGYSSSDANPNTAASSTSITMKGGTVDTIFGGGRGDTAASAVNSTSVYIDVSGGTVTNMIVGGGRKFSTVDNVVINVSGTATVSTVAGGGFDNPSTGIGLTEASNLSTATNIVKIATINIGETVTAIPNPNSATDPAQVYAGGPNGYTYTGEATVNIAGGDWDYVSGGASAGYVGSSEVNITGGNYDIVMGMTRGSNGQTAINVTGGTIANLYAGADVMDGPYGEVKGTIGQSVLSVTGGTVENVSAGFEAGTDLTNDTKLSLAYVAGTIVNTAGIAEFATNNLTQLVNVTIDGVVYPLVLGSKLADYDFSSLKIKDGHTFKGFVDAQGNAFSENTAITSSIVLKTDFVLNISDNPDTSDKIMLFAGLGIVGLIGLGASLVLLRKKLA